MKAIRTQKSNLISTTLASLLLIGAVANSHAAGTSTLTASDAAGSSSFNAVGHWSGGAAPGAGTNFFTSNFTLRTPVAAGNYTFQGDSLTIGAGGSIAIKGGSGNTITLNNLTNSGTISDAINPNTIAGVAGNMVVVNGAAFNTSSGSGDVRTITNGLVMSGTGTLTNTSTVGAFSGIVVYTANNSAFTGPLVVNNVQTVQAASLNNLGGNPASFNPAQLLLNNGTLQASGSFTMDNANSGITLGTGNGTFNVGTGFTLTVVNPITGPGSLTKSGLGTVILNDTNSYTNGTVVNGGILAVQNSLGVSTNGSVNQASGGRNSMITLQGGLTIPAAVGFILSNDGLGTNLPTTNALESISGDNTINGTITLTVGGGNAAIQSDSGAFVINGGVRIATGQSSRGVNLQGISTAANAINGPITDLSATSVNSVTKNGPGNWTLSGTNTYSGLTLINGGTLFVTGGGSISNTTLISIAAGATLDVSGMTTPFTLGATQSISNSDGTVNGSITTAAGAAISPDMAGVPGTLTITGDLNMNAGGTAYFDLGSIPGSGNDQIVVGGHLALSSSDYVHINAMAGALDTSDYVLFSVSAGTTMSTTPVLVWDNSVPGNYLNYSLVKSGNNVVLHYSASTAPSVMASVNPNSVSRNQATTVTASVTKGSGNIVNVTVDLSPIGGPAGAVLILDNTDSTPPTYIYTNTFTVTAGTTLGNKSLTVTATDDSSPSPLAGTYVITPLTVAPNNATWDGGASNDKWTSNTNWTSDIGPGLIGDSVTFFGTTRLTPDMDTNYTLTGVTFDSTAGAFTIGSSTSSTLTNGNGGIVNNSPSTQTLNVPIVNTAAQTFLASAGNLTLNGNIAIGGNALTVDGSANTSISGVISGTAGIAKNGGGTLLLSGVNTYGNNGASDTSINAGVLAIANDQALGSSRLNFGDGGILASADGSARLITNKLNFGSGAGGNVVFGGTGNLKLTGGANNGTDKVITVNNPQTEFSGAMSGASGRTVSGTGKLILSAANTYSAFTTINQGATLQLGNGDTNGSLATSSAIDDEGTLIFDRSDTLVQGTQFSGAPITGGGSIVQAGSGTTTLNAANTYSGSTIVNNGELIITTAYQGGGNVSVANDAKFGVSATSMSNSTTIGNLALGSGGATTLDFSYVFAGNPTNAVLSAGAVTINGTSSVRVGGAFVVGTFPVLKYSSLSGAFSSAVAGPRGVTATLSNDTINHVINVTISSIGSGIVWTGTNSLASNLWDLNTTTNWLIGGQPTTYIENVPPGDAVTFNDSGSGTVLLSNAVNPSSVTFSNSINYTLQGSGQIGSSATLTKVGSGSVTLNVPGTFTGSTILSNGTVNIGANQTFANLSGNSAVTTSAGAPTLTVNDNVGTTFAGTLSGSLSLNKGGSGTLTLINSNSFSGNLFVSLGGLTLDSGAISTGNFASIGHVGTDNGALTLKGIATFSTTSDFNVGDVGSSVGTVNVQDASTLTANAIYVGSANAVGSTASGTLNQTGGTVTELSTTAGTFSIGGRASGTSTGGAGTYNLSGGALTAASAIRVGAVGFGSFNQTGGTVVANGGVDLATIAGASGTYELDGGTLRTLNVTSSSIGSATMNFNGGVLIPTANNNGFVTNVFQVNVRDGGAVVDTTNFSVTIGSALQHSPIGGDNAVDGGLTKRGSGTLTLAGIGSSYTGPTTVTAGTLNFGANSVASLNNLTVNNATLGLGLNGSASFSAANVALVGNSTLNFYYDLVSGAPVTALNVSGSFTASGATTINVFGYGWTVGQFTLVDYTGSALPNLNNFTLGALPYGVNASLSNNAANSSIDLVVTGVGIGTWIPLFGTDTVGTSSFAAPGNWQDGNPPTAGNGYFTRTFAIRSPADANAYTFGGSALSVDSGGRFIMKGTGGQVMTVDNLIINGGLVDYANGADSFTETLAGNITLQAGTLSYMGALGSANLSETLFETAPIGGSGNLQFGGPTVNGGTDLGVVVLAATNTYTGTTTVASGTLLVNGANGNSPITVGANATLGGTGAIGGTINVQAGGNLAPGIATRGALTNVIGTLTASSAASVSGAVTMKISRDVSPNSDKFVALGVTVNSGATLTVANIGSTNFAAGDTFALFSTPINGAFSTVTLPILPAGNLSWTNKLAVNGTIAVVGAGSINPTPSPIAFSVTGGTLTLTWPQDHTGWQLQVQTNIPGTNWVAVPGSTATNAVSIPINAGSGSAFYRLKL